ncbi:MAG: PLP-dependent aminotransferase family protein [Sneathiella sp.]
MSIWLPHLKDRTGPKYLQIVEAMAEDIAEGRLDVGTRLPPYRELAYQLGISPNTASRAYTEAVKRALLRGETGRGTFVRPPGETSRTDAPNTLQRNNTGPIDLSRNLPLAGAAEPYIRRILKDISAEAGFAALLDYQTDDDLRHHSEAGILWLKMCGLEASSETLVTIMGGQHGLLCTLMGVLRPGDLLLTESLTYPPVCSIAEQLGLHIATVEMDAEGAIPESFSDLCKRAKPKAFYLTPTLQAPTTVTLSEKRRQAIAEIAQRHDVLLIEDDVFGPLKTDSAAPLAMLAPDHTVYITSLSKAVAPGLRVGFLRAPARLIPALRHAVNLSVWMTPPLMLEVAARVISDGTVLELVAHQRRTAERRQSLARLILNRVDFVSDPFGFHLWMPLPPGRRADILRAQCLKQDVLVSEARSFAIRQSEAPEAIRLCLSHEISEARLEKGLRIVAHLMHLAPSVSTMEI